jgi:preprotein translocase subunit SecG
MSILLIIVHIIVCVALIMIVLLQTGKGADMGAAFGGGGSQSLFGSTGASTFLSKATTVAAVVFMLTSLGLAYVSSLKGPTESIMETQKAPVEQTAPVAGNPGAGTESAPASPAASDSKTKN